MNQKTKKILIVSCILIFIFGIKILSFPNDYEREKDNHKNDLDAYLKLSTNILKGNEEDRQYQYPPLYSILLIPALFTDTTAFVLILNIMFSVFTFFPLWLISKRFTKGFFQYLIPFVIILFDMVFTYKSYGYPMALSAFLLAWFIYFFMDIHLNRKYVLYSGIIFGLMIATKYVFFYMVPFLSLWILFHRR